jgi:hypothetical protein
MHNKLKIIYKNNKPYGIRDENSFLFFFADVSKYPNQEERYRREVQAQFALADYLLVSLQARGLTQRAGDKCPNCHNGYISTGVKDFTLTCKACKGTGICA